MPLELACPLLWMARQAREKRSWRAHCLRSGSATDTSTAEARLRCRPQGFRRGAEGAGAAGTGALHQKCAGAEGANHPRCTGASCKLAPTGRQALAAALILFVVGGGIGYLFGIQPAGAPAVAPAAPAPSRTWLDDIAALCRIYSHQPHHIVEVQATEADEINKWLTGTVGREIQCT